MRDHGLYPPLLPLFFNRPPSGSFGLDRLSRYPERHFPNLLVEGVALLGVFYGGIETLLSAMILGALGYGLYKLYPRMRGKEVIGLGDVKLMAASGLWLHPAQIPLFLILTGLGGVLMALLWKVLKRGPKFPLGPALAFALGICIMGALK